MPSLALAEASSVKCCFYIKNHPQLRKLEVNGAWISSKTLKKIAGLRHLQELKLVQVDNSDVRLLQPLSDLKRLELGGNWQHFEALKNFEDLESFAIEGGEPSLPKEEIYKLLHSLPENLHELQIIGMPT
ncbi:MAG: hypothetical protein FJZ63_04630, partial [Chlamydiae bacterium]|nr:hypothetical protein [Chlamydiota bacterium]